MLNFLPRHIVAFIGLLIQVLNIFICGAYIFALAPFKVLLPIRPAQIFVRKLLRFTPAIWSSISAFSIWLCTKTEWDIQLPNDIMQDESCMLICNHQSWNDILVNQKVFFRKLPPSVYFMKRELLAVPILGWGCWLLDFPFMQRYTKKYLEKHPEKRGQDIATAQRSCAKFIGFPSTIVNYPEGTRFTQAKHDLQQSPFKHLLKPKATGVALALQAMQNQVKHIVNVTIIYPYGVKGLWDFLSGAIKKVVVRAEVIPVTTNLIGDYLHDDRYREHFQAWLNDLWQKKDRLITDVLKAHGNA